MSDSGATDRVAARRSVGTRLRAALLGVVGGTLVAWLAWPLIGLLSTYLRLPPDFEPLALVLLVAVVAMAGLAGWFYDPGESEEGPDASSAEPHRRQ